MKTISTVPLIYHAEVKFDPIITTCSPCYMYMDRRFVDMSHAPVYLRPGANRNDKD